MVCAAEEGQRQKKADILTIQVTTSFVYHIIFRLGEGLVYNWHVSIHL